MDGLTFYGLVADLKKLRTAQGQVEEQLKEMARVYPGLARHIQFVEIKTKTPLILLNLDDLIREYEQKNKEAEQTEGEVNETIQALLKQLPAGYPAASFTKNTEGYMLEIDRTIIFQGASSPDAIKHTTNYVDARRRNPDLPIGVIYGIYD